MAGYQGYSSSFSIDDTAANIISAGDGTLANGNINVDVTSGPVDAADGAILSAFTADVDFDVTDTAGNISAEVGGRFKIW